MLRLRTMLSGLIRHPGRFLALVLLGGFAFALTACATIMQGSSQEVSISSTPTGAKVLIDGMDQGVTPVAARLRRKDQHTVRIELAGYKPYELKFTRATSGWVWGNIVFGGIPGLAVDAITGGLYKLRPEQVEASLQQETAMVGNEGDRMVVAITLTPITGAELIGQLDKE